MSRSQNQVEDQASSPHFTHALIKEEKSTSNQRPEEVVASLPIVKERLSSEQLHKPNEDENPEVIVPHQDDNLQK